MNEIASESTSIVCCMHCMGKPSSNKSLMQSRILIKPVLWWYYEEKWTHVCQFNCSYL